MSASSATHTKAKVSIAVLASGRGSNFDAIAGAIDSGQLDAEISLVLSDKPQAPVLEKAKARGIKTVCVEAKKSGPLSVESRQLARLEHDKAVLVELKRAQPRFVVLAGYMRIVTSHLIEAFRSERGYSRIVNIHPSILPAFPGVSSYQQAFEYGCKTTGVTVHLVEDEVDSGPVCAQEAFTIADCKSVEEVEQRGLKIEHRLFSETLKWILPEAFSVEKRGSGRICVRAN